ncbi:sulfatase [Algibacter miyuki]|uniref:Sulfatase n=1 Tax=Algibacter miyuki TaxID=1306933 RepID=A0ABV5GZF5_9FLAO|nr:sulfatase [Algibacter miyuki]MDN3666810.1 sulfatase [Algibacter miyuki]
MKYLKKNSALFLVLITLLGCKSNKTVDQVSTKPNIVFIVVDDLGYSDIGYMQHKPEIQTPNIDKLAKTGMIFTDAYAASPVCSPTRASLVTGKSPAALKLTCHIPGMGMEKYLKKLSKGKKLKEAHFLNHLPEDELTIAEVLKTQGYSTGYIGKWHLGGDGSIYTEDGIVDEKFNPNHFGFDVNIGGCAYGQPASYFSPYKNGTMTDGPKGEYLTDRLGDEAVRFIENNKEKPFFLNLATYTVHTPLGAPAENIKKYEGNKYFAMIEKLDENVGKVMATLESLNLLENTIVMFYSDNGGLWGNAPLKGIKGTLNEGGIRVPLIVNWANKVPAGSTCNKPVTSVDFFPTMLELAKLSPENYKGLEGMSFLPLALGKTEVADRPLYWHFPHHRKEGLSMGAAIRYGKWKYIVEFESEKEFLYNLENDLGEETNLMQRFPEKGLELSQKLKQWQSDVSAEMPELNL